MNRQPPPPTGINAPGSPAEPGNLAAPSNSPHPAVLRFCTPFRSVEGLQQWTESALVVAGLVPMQLSLSANPFLSL